MLKRLKKIKEGDVKDWHIRAARDRPLNLRLGEGKAAARSNTPLQAREAAGTEGDPSYSCVGNKATG